MKKAEADIADKNVDRINGIVRRTCAMLKPPGEDSVTKWADMKRRLSSESSAEVGQWRTSRTPYLQEIMDAYTDPMLHMIAFVSSSQVGKSEFLNNCVGYVIDDDPSSMLFIHPTDTDASEYSKLRIAPMIRDCPSLKKKVSPAKSRDSANTILQKAFPGGILTMCGSQVAHNLASKPIRRVLGDELDRWAVSAGNEGDPWDLARKRQITFYNSMACAVSTPTIKGHSKIETLYGLGTMERWKVKCPHCGEYHEITFETIRYEHSETVVSGKKTYKVWNINYVCPGCACVSDERTMKHQPARWEAENPDAYEQGNRSFWLSSWVSPWLSWKSMLTEYMNALGDTRKMQVVYNTLFGQLWEDRGDIEDEDTLMSRREEYKAELPEGVLVLTCGVDTQDDRLEYEVVGHGHFGETWGIKKGIIMGRPDNAEVWAKLDEVIDHIYRFGDDVGLRISTTFVDEGGHFTQEVRSQCQRRLGKKVFAIKGRGGSDIPYTDVPRKQKIVINGKAIGMCWVYQIGVDAGKQLIMDNLHVKTPGPKYCHFPLRDDYGPGYFTGLLSERLVYKEGLKHPWQWEKIPGHERNEALDCRDYANAACKALSPNFDAIDRRLKETRGKGPQPAPVQNMVQRPKKTQKTNLSKYMDDW